MAHVSTAVEYGLHCLLYLVGPADAPPIVASARDVGELQGVSPEYVAKVFTRLEKAGLVEAMEGVDGGFKLARAAETISVLDVVDAIDGQKPLFECQNIRLRNAVFEGEPPAWASEGTCGIHAVMLLAERKMREVLASHTLVSLTQGFGRKAPADFGEQIVTWLSVRKQNRRGRTVDVSKKRKAK